MQKGFEREERKMNESRKIIWDTGRLDDNRRHHHECEESGSIKKEKKRQRQPLFLLFLWIWIVKLTLLFYLSHTIRLNMCKEAETSASQKEIKIKLKRTTTTKQRKKMKFTLEVACTWMRNEATGWVEKNMETLSYRENPKKVDLPRFDLQKLRSKRERMCFLCAVRDIFSIRKMYNSKQNEWMKKKMKRNEFEEM